MIGPPPPHVGLRASRQGSFTPGMFSVSLRMCCHHDSRQAACNTFEAGVCMLQQTSCKQDIAGHEGSMDVDVFGGDVGFLLVLYEAFLVCQRGVCGRLASGGILRCCCCCRCCCCWLLCQEAAWLFQSLQHLDKRHTHTQACNNTAVHHPSSSTVQPTHPTPNNRTITTKMNTRELHAEVDTCDSHTSTQLLQEGQGNRHKNCHLSSSAQRCSNPSSPLNPLFTKSFWTHLILPIIPHPAV